MAPPLVSGLTIVRDGRRLDYPFVEAIRSALPICDEYVVVVGAGGDGTLEAVRAIGDPRIRVLETEWSELVTPRWALLAQQTNLGLHLCRGRWCLYMQANEVLHERDLPRLREMMERHAEDRRVEALLLERLTFWADYRHWLTAYPDRYKYSPRVVRPQIGMHSIRDASSFAVFDGWSTRGRYPRALDTGCDLHRYGKVHTLAAQSEVLRGAVHHRDRSAELADDYFYATEPRAFVARFTGTHPAVMAARAAAHPPQYELDDPRCRLALTGKERRRRLETAFYRRFGVPRWRSARYRLLAGYLPKPR